ncbi:hypothetical protein BH09VER1_BH09VER1_20050 [soil metagenome]
MKIAANIVGVLLGLLFLLASVTYFLMIFHVMPMPTMPSMGPLAEDYMKVMGPSGYLTFVKCFEFIGAILVTIPRLRNFGLLILGPILINIVAFHIFVAKGAGLFDPMIILIVIFEAFLLWADRKAFLGLIRQ